MLHFMICNDSIFTMASQEHIKECIDVNSQSKNDDEENTHSYFIACSDLLKDKHGEMSQWHLSKLAPMI